MNLPFTPEQFFHVFGRYNLAVWPIQYVLVGAALVAVVLVVFLAPEADGGYLPSWPLCGSG